MNRLYQPYYWMPMVVQNSVATFGKGCNFMHSAAGNNECVDDHHAPAASPISRCGKYA
jgi:hypothetical protein